MSLRLEFARQARADLRSIGAYIARSSGGPRGAGFVRRIEAACRALTDFPHRGTRRDDLHPGLCHVGMRRQVTIAFVVRDDSVRIMRVLYGGRSLESAFARRDG